MPVPEAPPHAPTGPIRLPNERSGIHVAELANAVSHGFGLIAALISTPILILAATAHGDTRQIVACGVFAATLVTLYAASTIYHALPPGGAKRLFQRVDHAAIYLLIAGTYTPFTIGLLRGAWGWSLFGIVWGLTLGGILFKLFLGIRLRVVSTVLYLGMGWMAVVAMRPLAAVLPGPGLLLLLAGGLLYTTGVIFYIWDRPRYHHAVWHLFVLGGSTCHFLAVLRYATHAPA
ncbi:MAG: hemolysin III family protein [Gemmatimonadales bacterium]